MKQCVMIATDKAPSDACLKIFHGDQEDFDLYFTKYSGTLDESRRYLGGHPYFIEKADVMLVGMSSSEELAMEEIAAAESAVELRIPFGFFADTFGVVNRPWLAHLRDKASFVFVINEDEARKAKAIFPNAEIVVSGNPNREDFFFPKRTYKDVRKELGVLPDEKMILCPGGKNLKVNLLHWGGVIEAVSGLANREKFKIFLSCHPGDKNDLGLYGDLAKHDLVDVQIMTRDIMTSSDLLVGSDLVIGSASGINIEAACQRKPVIDYFSEAALSRLEGATGSRVWEPCELGVSFPVESNIDVLATVIEIFSDKDHFPVFEMIQKQIKVFPRPVKRGEPVRIIIETLKRFAK